MLVVQIGGPAYPIGIGGGSFSSKAPGNEVSGGDLNAIQRPDPATERSLYNVFRRCVELGSNNPIESSHDLGAGGSANALPEIVGKAGGRIAVKSLPVGDTGMSVLQIFVCEAQERNVVLVRTENWSVLKEIAARESAVAMVVGAVIGDGQVVLFDANSAPDAPDHLQSPVNLPATAFDGSGVIEPVHFTRQDRRLEPLHLPKGLTVLEALQRVFRLMTVGSKHFLVDKVDRSVGGRVAQQQCVGPFHLPLCGYGLTAHSLTEHRGTAFAHGERHRLGFISPAAQARMSVVEMLQKLMSVVITDLTDIRFSGNWMWPPLAEGGNGVRLHDAAIALSEICVGLGIAEDGGKDSIFMRTFDNKGRLVVSPGQLVLAPYVTVADVRRKVTPELKEEGNSLILVDLSDGNARMGGSALAQVYGQVGDHCPDLASSKLLKQAFAAVQEMVARGEVVSLHGRSDGGLITTLVEMAIAGGHGIDVRLDSVHQTIPALFNEEAGVVIETAQPGLAQMTLERFGVPCQVIGKVQGRNDPVLIRHNGTSVLYEILEVLRSQWSDTSSRIDETQSNPAPIRAERQQMSRTQRWPAWHLTYIPSPSFRRRGQAKVAVLRA
ncbi:MAG TPA: AIR synthase-related protein, partial [Glaciihabitans sp.]|nr:AIR synthase-related protein [Glaciihabitans sp.]